MFGWFKSKPSSTLPSAAAEPERYKGRPLLILLENYVLDCIGQLPPGMDASLVSAVQRIFGGDADWKKTLRERLDLAPGLDDHIKELWQRNQAIAKQRSEELQPVQFAKMVADSNFAQHIETLGG